MAEGDQRRPHSGMKQHEGRTKETLVKGEGADEEKKMDREMKTKRVHLTKQMMKK